MPSLYRASTDALIPHFLPRVTNTSTCPAVPSLGCICYTWFWRFVLLSHLVGLVVESTIVLPSSKDLHPWAASDCAITIKLHLFCLLVPCFIRHLTKSTLFQSLCQKSGCRQLEKFIGFLIDDLDWRIHQYVGIGGPWYQKRISGISTALRRW